MNLIGRRGFCELVIPANAEIQRRWGAASLAYERRWVPAFAGTTAFLQSDPYSSLRRKRIHVASVKVKMLLRFRGDDDQAGGAYSRPTGSTI